MAPIVPFLTEYVWGILRGVQDADSVHLTTWPGARPGDWWTGGFSAQMALFPSARGAGQGRARAAASPGHPPSRSPRALVGRRGEMFADPARRACGAPGSQRAQPSAAWTRSARSPMNLVDPTS